MNQTSRRNFVLTAGMASGVAMFGGVSSIFAASSSSSVSGVISRYGSKISSTHLDDQTVEYRVKVHSYEKFANVFGDQDRLHWDRIEALEGNVLKLTGKGQTILLKHV